VKRKIKSESKMPQTFKKKMIDDDDLTPEERLMVGLLEGAIKDILSGDKSKHNDGLKFFFCEEDSRFLYTFRNICEHYDTTPDRLRNKIFYRIGKEDLI